MDGQMSIADYQMSLAYNRRGKQYPAPEWAMERDNCKDCKYWELLPENEQPPDGWGVMGQCNFIHSDEQIGYTKTEEFSYCQNWINKWEC